MKRSHLNQVCCCLLVTVGPILGNASGQGNPEANPSDRQLQVLWSHRITAGNHSIVFNRVSSPAISKTPSSTVSSDLNQPPLSADLQIASVETLTETLLVTAEVFENGVSEITWRYDEKQYRAFSNIDFCLLAGVTEIQTSQKNYVLMTIAMKDPRLGDEHGAVWLSATKQVPPLSAFSAARAEYYVVEEDGGPVPDDALHAIDEVHGFFDAHKSELTQAQIQREAEFAAKEQWKKLHPLVPQNTTINFWPVKSRVYGDAQTHKGQR